MIINKTLDFSDLRDPDIRPTVSSINRWVWRWLLRGERLGVNGAVKRRAYIRPHKMWEYARGLALTGASVPVRDGDGPFRVLDVGGSMTAPLFYLAVQGDRVLSLDIDDELNDQTNRAAARRALPVEARHINLAERSLTAAELDSEEGFDRIYCFCVIEHVPHPGQGRLAGQIGRLLMPGGRMCLTFDFGDDAPTQEPLRTVDDVARLRDSVGLPLVGNAEFVDLGTRYPLDRRHPQRRYTFGSLFFERP